MSQLFMSSRKRSSGCGWNNSTAASSRGAPTIRMVTNKSTDNDIHTCTPDEVAAKTFDLRGGRQQAQPDVGRLLDGRVDLSGQRMATGGLAHASVANGQP